MRKKNIGDHNKGSHGHIHDIFNLSVFMLLHFNAFNLEFVLLYVCLIDNYISLSLFSCLSTYFLNSLFFL